MKSLLIVFIFLAIFSSFQSCEKAVDIEPPAYTPKLVLHSFISPDDTLLRVHVSTTINIFGKVREYPSSLPVTITLIDGEKETVFETIDSAGFCSLRYQVEPGKEYGLFAKCTGYPDASAKCRLPSRKSINITVDTLTESMFENVTYKTFKFKTKFDDIPGETNYYNIFATRVENSVYGMNVYPLNLINSEDNYGFYSTRLVSDHLIDGKTIFTEFSTYYDKSERNLTSLELNAYVLETDADYFKFHNSLKNYTGSDEPFTEFSPVYTNVSGGFGIFASYVRYKKTLKLK